MNHIAFMCNLSKYAKCPVGFPHNKYICLPNVNSLKADRNS